MMRRTRRFPVDKKYIVRLTAQERDELVVVIKKLKGTSEKVRRAQILLKADADGPNWTDHRIAEAFGCRRQTVENIRQRLVEHGFREALDRKMRETPPVVTDQKTGAGFDRLASASRPAVDRGVSFQ